MTEFSLEGRPHVTLDNLLKLLGWASSGGEAKLLIADGMVRVAGEVELRKRCKVTSGKVVEFDGMSVKVSD